MVVDRGRKHGGFCRTLTNMARDRMAWGPHAASASRVTRHLFWPWLPLRFEKACVRGAQPLKQLSKKG